MSPATWRGKRQGKPAGETRSDADGVEGVEESSQITRQQPGETDGRPCARRRGGEEPTHLPQRQQHRTRCQTARCDGSGLQTIRLARSRHRVRSSDVRAAGRCRAPRSHQASPPSVRLLSGCCWVSVSGRTRSHPRGRRCAFNVHLGPSPVFVTPTTSQTTKLGETRRAWPE